MVEGHTASKEPSKNVKPGLWILELTSFSSDHRIYMGDKKSEAIICVISHGSYSYFCRKHSVADCLDFQTHIKSVLLTTLTLF